MNQSQDSTKPESVEISNREQVLEIEWADGHKSVYPLYGLRKNCPCVACRGGHSEMGKFEMAAFYLVSPPEVQIRNLEPIGNHAVKISWGDGHDTGMYRWELLRAMCPQLHLERKGLTDN